MKNRKNLNNMTYNMTIFPIYKALSWDTLFYYAIEFLFLTQIKGLSAAQVLFVDAFYPLFKFILEIPSNIIVQKFGKRRSLILGNLFIVGDLLFLILSSNMHMIILAWFLSAFGYALKGLTESNLLYDSIPKGNNRGTIFGKIDGKANSIFYFFDAISAISTGFLFVINGYLPMILSLIISIIALLLSFNFKEVDSSIDNSTKKTSLKSSLMDLKHATQFIIKSNRLRSLVLFDGFFCAFIGLYSTLRSSILTDIGLPAQYFGLIYAGLQLISCITSAYQEKFHNRYRNRTLSFFATRTTISFIFIGLSTLIGLNFGLTLEIILLLMAIQYAIKGPFYTLIKRYLNNFSSSSLRTKISLISELLYSILRAILCFICSALLEITTTSYVYIILGCVFTIFFIFLLDYMKTSVGLKPEEYEKKEIEFVEIH
ncbi:MAG: MFS transporter [Clostridia bacterium]|nr:MFS transporter [Clostridia bacterium]